MEMAGKGAASKNGRKSQVGEKETFCILYNNVNHDDQLPSVKGEGKRFYIGLYVQIYCPNIYLAFILTIDAL